MIAQKDPEQAAYDADSTPRGKGTYLRDGVVLRTSEVVGQQLEEYNKVLEYIDFGANKLITELVRGNTRGATIAAIMFTVNVATAGNGGKAVVIGRKMETRVIPVATAIGASYYNARGKIPANWLANNIKWIQRQIANGSRVFDIGSLPELAESASYNAEIEQLLKAGFERVKRDTITVEGKVYTLYEWIKK